MRLRTTKSDARRSGMVLLAVLVVSVLLTLAAYHYSEWMLAEYQAADSSARAAQARAFADSGIHYAAALLADPSFFAGGEGGNPYDNQQLFHRIAVSPDEAVRYQGRFSVIAPVPASTGLRFGVVDEAGKINVNALLQFDSSGKVGHDMLMKLPGMTDEIANAILDWIDSDDQPRTGGAESDYYSGLNPPYLAKNGPIESLDELLLVRGITPDLLYGDDRNRNGLIDDDEVGELGLGWSAYLTFYGREQNLDSTGAPRIYVNDSDLQGLFDKLSTAVGPELANYILAYRIYGPSTGSNQKGGSGGARSAGSLSRNQLNFNQGRPRNIASLFELIGTMVAIPGNTPQAQPTYYASPLSDAGTLRQLLPSLLDKVTTIRDAEIPGRININTAPEEVLRALPSLSDADVQSIVSHRPQIAAGQSLDAVYQSPAWLVTEANISLNTVRTLEKYVTTRTQVYRVHSIGYFEAGGPSARIEAIIDTNSGRPRIVYWRDLTELGRGYDATTGQQR